MTIKLLWVLEVIETKQEYPIIKTFLGNGRNIFVAYALLVVQYFWLIPRGRTKILLGNSLWNQGRRKYGPREDKEEDFKTDL